MTLEKYLDDRETWQNNTIEEIKKKVIYKPKSLKNSRVGEKLVAIYGPPQIGKTTLILCLIGIAPEFQKKVYNDIRAGVPRGNSSTSTAIICRCLIIECRMTTFKVVSVHIFTDCLPCETVINSV